MNVTFFLISTQQVYDNLSVKDPWSLYWVESSHRLYKGDQLYATGLEATKDFAGLLSAEDKAFIEELKEGGGVPTYEIEKQDLPEQGFSASYKLKQTLKGVVSYVGDTINIAKDLVLQKASLKTVYIADIPYDGAEVGDPYIEMVFNDDAVSSLYIPVKDLVDTYAAGNGINIFENRISLALAANAHGLEVNENGLTLALATSNSDGAMSKEDKKILDNIPKVYETYKYSISNLPTNAIVNYGEKEIRILCPKNAAWTHQVVYTEGDLNTYYLVVKAYAPSEAASFKKGINNLEVADEMFVFSGDEAGVDEQGRKYAVCYLPAAIYDSTTDKWTYIGAISTINDYFGYFYSFEWYNAEGNRIGGNSIRVNLSNENCHNYAVPYYMNEYITNETLEELIESGELKGESGVHCGSEEPTDDSDVWIDPDGEMSDLRGPSAYEVAVENGFEGTEKEWLVSLRGENYVLTEEDKTEIANIILAELVNAEGLSV